MPAGDTIQQRAIEFGITLDLSNPSVVSATYKGYTRTALSTPARPNAGILEAMFYAVQMTFQQPDPPTEYDKALSELIYFLYKIEAYALRIEEVDAQIRQFRPRSSAPAEWLAEYDSLDRKAVRFPAYRDQAEVLYQAVKSAKTQ